MEPNRVEPNRVGLHKGSFPLPPSREASPWKDFSTTVVHQLFVRLSLVDGSSGIAGGGARSPLRRGIR